ncbi:aldo/keto reductase [Aureimonas sp. SA4125]|uniref:aldo/keto reductase n=1 Tax=Aureimonas sp. SA4125 TaxID=2826993 RepID=UPI001CC3A277|nr:aldo/keto reductase [Aureimonas sp. SA4125]
MKIIEANGARIPAIGYGTYTLEGQRCSEMVAKAIETGYRHIDTARMYKNEAAVGEGIRQSGIARDDLFVTTKVWWADIAEGKLQASAREAIETLGIGAVDLLLIHWPNADVALEESIDALNETIDLGLTRHIGVANFTSAMLDEAAALSEAPLACNQVEYHPFLSQDAIYSACRRHGMAMVAYSPVGQGGDILENAEIVGIAARHGKTPAQIVLRWEIQRDGVAAIPRTKTPERLAENLAVFDFELSPDEQAALTALTLRRKRLVDPSFAPNWDRV